MAADTVFTFLDSYCERAGHAGGFAEPLNLVTNLFFILAAVMAAHALWRPSDTRHPELVSGSIEKNTSAQTRRDGCRNKFGMTDVLDLWLLIFFLFAIGIGSGLWHWQPSGATLLMDVLPITLFINLYIISALRRLFDLLWLKVAMWWAISFGLGIVGQVMLPPGLFNGTIMYIPTYLTLLVMTLALWGRDKQAARAFAGALGVWTLSLIFRTVDHEICPSLGFGTHFLWHTLNAWVLWRLLKVLIDRATPKPRP